jgi:hypothetical protein
MSIFAALPVIGGLLDKLIPDKDARAAAQELLQQSEQSGELQLMLGQMEVNKVEAASGSLFRGGWRPAVGWVCASAMFYSFVLCPLMQFIVILVMDEPPTFPELSMGELMPVLMGMLGFGAMRMNEKIKGVG